VLLAKALLLRVGTMQQLWKVAQTIILVSLAMGLAASPASAVLQGKLQAKLFLLKGMRPMSRRERLAMLAVSRLVVVTAEVSDKTSMAAVTPTGCPVVVAHLQHAARRMRRKALLLEDTSTISASEFAEN
jgi:hypothetical protein